MREDHRNMARFGHGHAIFLSVLCLVLVMCVGLAAAKNKKKVDKSTTQYVMLKRTRGRDTALCYGRTKCFLKTLVCPKQCRRRSTVTSKKRRSCFIDCSPKCEATCKRRRPKCKGFGAICYDPRFVGGDGKMFYFHGAANENFCIVTDENLHINAHFIGKQVEGRQRDYTWVQALGIMFGNHKLIVAANKVATWDENEDQLYFSYDGIPFVIEEGESNTWSSKEGLVTVERTDEVNGVEVIIQNQMSLAINVEPITEEDSRIHNYGITSEDCFAHLNLQFKFFNLSDQVDGVLGQTYRPDFINPVKVGVEMPIMGGEEKFHASSLLAPDCHFNKFSPKSYLPIIASNVSLSVLSASCGSDSSGGMICRR